MARKSLTQCIDKILSDIELRKSVEYGDRRSVRQYNAAYDRIAKNVKYIESNYPDQINVFADLLGHTDQSVSFMCACMILNVLKCSSSLKQTALNEIKRQFHAGAFDSTTALCMPLLIQEWEERIAELEESERKASRKKD